MNDLQRNKITYLSFALALLIIVRHSIGIETYSSMPVWLYYVEKCLSHFTDLAVPTFFAVSGFLFYYNFTFEGLTKKWKSRLRTVVLPFIIWNLIGFLFIFAMSHIAGKYMNSTLPTFTLESFLLDVFIRTKYNVTWFLLYLIIYIYTTPALYKLLVKKVIGGGIIIITLILGYLYYDSTQSGLILYSVPYLFGAYMGIHCKELCLKTYNNNQKLLALCVVLITVPLETILGFGEGPTMTPIRLIQISMVWIITDVLATDLKPQWYFGISFFIYCIHSFILESIEKCFFLVFGDTVHGAVLDLVFAPMITLTVILIIAHLLRKLPWAWAPLTGGRG